MPNSKNKGSNFEREICTLLSEWWEPGRSDIFWRTASSGGRATQRAKKGTKTKNHHGDITATDPIGQPFLDVFTLELKRGYSSCSIADLIDKPNKAAPTQYEKWIEGIILNATQAGSQSWMLIVKRNRKQTLVFTSQTLMQSLEELGGKQLTITLPVYFILSITRGKGRHIVGTTLEGFLDAVKPSLVRLLAEIQRKKRA
jgi:hypothetical protein